MNTSLMVNDVIGIAAVAIAVVASVASILGALRAGVLRRIRLGAIEFEASSMDDVTRAAAAMAAPPSREIPFEIEQLTNYYTQILAQARISFWFSLIFASLGFLIIVAAAFLYQEDSGASTVAQFSAGLILDAVAALFFAQSRNAQKSMAEFFDKLRGDRLHMESRRLVDSIASSPAQDAVRLHLALHFAGVENADRIAEAIADRVGSS